MTEQKQPSPLWQEFLDKMMELGKQHSFGFGPNENSKKQEDIKNHQS